MNQQDQQNNQGSVADGFGTAAFVLAILGIVFLVFLLRVETAKKLAEDYTKDLTTPRGHLIGKVAKVETWKAEPFQHKENGGTLTLEITDRCRITFTDGRSKELVGMPKETVPTDKEVAVVWARFDILLEIVDAEEFKKREKKPGPKEEAN